MKCPRKKTRSQSARSIFSEFACYLWMQADYFDLMFLVLILPQKLNSDLCGFR